jgi:hypothetical protein
VVALGLSVVAMGRGVVVSIKIVEGLVQDLVRGTAEVGEDLIPGGARMRVLVMKRRMKKLSLVRNLKLWILKKSGTDGKERVNLLGTNKWRKILQVLICRRRRLQRKKVR